MGKKAVPERRSGFTTPLGL
ncbi:hypothetical protein AVEN_111551-1, partial [Araneus ventricosus]